MEKNNPEKPGPIGSMEIPGMTSKLGYEEMQKNPIIPKIDEKAKKQMEETKEKLEAFKKELIEKHPFTLAVGIVPPQAAERFDEELGLTEEEKKKKPMHLIVVIPEEQFKNISKIKAEIIEQTKEMKPAIWVNLVTPVDLANYCLDSKFDIIEAIGMSFPLYDKGILGAFRISAIHKSLCLRKFEKYIYSYVVFGSIIRGEAKKTSDIDVFIIIDDTDVKRMSRIELKEKLRGIIYQYVAEATDLSGVKTPLHVQVYLLTEFWEDVKDASPVIFGAIRDGIPLYDRGGFLPWKLLLRMGKITPSPESIDRFMSMGDKNKEIVNRRLIDAMIDIYYSILSPSQALLMLYGIPPTNVPETVREMKRIFVEKEKILEKKYADILEKIAIKYWKGYEHGEIKEISGKEVDELLKDSEDYMKRLKELRSDIELKSQERILEGTYKNIFEILENLFGKKSEQQLVKEFEEQLVNKGKADSKLLHVLHEIIDTRKRFKSKKKPSKYEIEDIRKNASYLINQLIEYGQRCDLAQIDRMRARIVYGKSRDKHAEIFLTNPAFLIQEGKIRKITEKEVENGTQEEFENILASQKGKPNKFTEKLMKVLKEEFGEFDIGL